MFTIPLKNLGKERTKFNSILASDNYCRLLKTFADSFDPDQDRHSVGPDLDLNCLKL